MKAIIAGYGRMGHMIEELLLERGHEVAGTIDVGATEILEKGDKVADMIIDFSNPSLTDELVKYAGTTGTPLLSGTTNLTAEQLEGIRALGAQVPAISSSNYSLGIAIFRHVLSDISPMLKDWDIEVTETHHNKKVDAPSGTAKDLIRAIDPDDQYEKVYGREGSCGARTRKEIGVHALRGGTVAGEHTVDFFGSDEIFEITHRAGSRRIFAEGAVKTAEKLIELAPGFYTMDSILFG